MSYLTKHSFDIPQKYNTEEITDELFNTIKNDFMSMSQEIHDAIEFTFMNKPCEWYTCSEDMMEFSKKYPKIVIQVYGEGENNADMWAAYALNGQLDLCRAETYIPEPEFDCE